MSDKGRAIFNFGPDEHLSRELFLSRVHPEDRNTVDEAIERARPDRRHSKLNIVSCGRMATSAGSSHAAVRARRSRRCQRTDRCRHRHHGASQGRPRVATAAGGNGPHEPGIVDG